MRYSTKGSALTTLESIARRVRNTHLEYLGETEFGFLLVVQEGSGAGQIIGSQTGSFDRLPIQKLISELRGELDIGFPISSDVRYGFRVFPIKDDRNTVFGAVWTKSKKDAPTQHAKEALFDLAEAIKRSVFQSKRRVAAKNIRNALTQSFKLVAQLESFMAIMGSQAIASNFVCTWLENDEGDLQTSHSDLNLRRGLGIASHVASSGNVVVCRLLSEGILVEGQRIKAFHHQFLEAKGLNSAVFVPIKLEFEGRLGVAAYYFKRPNGCTECDVDLAQKLTDFFSHQANELLFRNRLKVTHDKRAQSFSTLLEISKVLHDIDNVTQEMDGLIASMDLNPSELHSYVQPLKLATDKLFSLSENAQRVKANVKKGNDPRHESKQGVFRRETKQIADRLTQRHKKRLEDKGIKLEITDRANGRFLAHQESIDRIIDNLIQNAEFVLSGAGQSGKRKILIIFDWDAEKSLLSVSVKDNGRGFESDKERRQALEPFVSGKPGGWGLGLPICSDLANAMGGRLDSWSRWGEGALFTARLPVELY